MHVGHLRTTVVGDSLARTLEHLGHDVIRQNHIGDWGTPFGMLIEHLLDVGEGTDEALVVETDPNAFYQAARAKFDGDPTFAESARARVVALQARRRRDSAPVARARRAFQALLQPDLRRSLASRCPTMTSPASRCTTIASRRSATNSKHAGIATISEGALCVFLDGYTGREGKPVPLIIRKSDGGYGYGTTDLATVRYRIETLQADRLIYVIGAPQALHLNMVWDTARKAGWLPAGSHAGPRPDRQRARARTARSSRPVLVHRFDS